jgi:hypothetical protein
VISKHRYIVLIPLLRKDGKHQDGKAVKNLLGEIGGKWGGYSLERPCGGYWQEKENNKIIKRWYDICIPVLVDIDDKDNISDANNWFNNKQKDWKNEEYLNQECVYIISFPISSQEDKSS